MLIHHILLILLLDYFHLPLAYATSLILFAAALATTSKALNVAIVSEKL